MSEAAKKGDVLDRIADALARNEKRDEEPKARAAGFAEDDVAVDRPVPYQGVIGQLWQIAKVVRGLPKLRERTGVVSGWAGREFKINTIDHKTRMFTVVGGKRTDHRSFDDFEVIEGRDEPLDLSDPEIMLQEAERELQAAKKRAEEAREAKAAAQKLKDAEDARKKQKGHGFAP